LSQGEFRMEPRLRRRAEGKLTVLKLGGSVITEKNKPMTAKPEVMERLAREIVDADATPLVIVHGGGSFGHTIAKKYKIKEGYSEPSQIEGFSKTHQAMLELNRLVVGALIRNNIAAFPVSPSSCMTTNLGRIEAFYDSTTRRLLDTGFVPVFFGDTVLDSSLGFTILSGDQIVAALAVKLRASRVIFGVDVDGLYTADPKRDSSAQLIPRITLQELRALLHNIGGAQVDDVTGGMIGKVSELIPAVEAGAQTFILSAAKEGNVYKALKKEEVGGTLIERE
jgi:isopentenyl phosphate kinase